MSKYQRIFIDLDGTLTDSGPGILNCVRYALSKFDITDAPEEVLRCFIGPPLTDAFSEYFGFSEEDAKTAVLYYRERYTDIGLFENTVYDGIPEMLSRLREAGKTLILATAKPEPFAKRILEHFGLDSYFDLMVGATFDGTRHNKIDVLRHALSGVKDASIKESVMVGDRSHDCLGAAHFGMDCIGVLYGYGSREELTEAGAKHLAKTPEDVCQIILE
ncbi:MAG: HAD family hydrolase [Clostridia bacterium]|nr:HAD family hydrolase [Clostridia bacterium]